jgi:hypothetical protein
LPAASLSLVDDSVLPDQARVGEPLTRTIRLRAQGLGFEQLPELEMDKPAGTEVYADKADTQTRDDGTWLYGERTRKFAIVPNRTGTLTLPEVRVQWWDTVHDRLETAVLPAHRIEVLPATAGSTSTADTNASVPVPAMPAGDTVRVDYPGSGNDSSGTIWRALALACGALWLLTLALWWRSSRTASHAAAANPVARAPGRSELMRACALGDLAGAERALVLWARGERPDLRNVGELIAALGAEDQRQVLDDLLRMRYAGAQQEGLGARLSRAFRSGLHWKEIGSAPEPVSALPALYPGDR